MIKGKIVGSEIGTNLSADNYRFTFVRESTGDSLKIRVKEEIFPKGSFQLRKKVKYGKTVTPQEKEAFKAAKQELKQVCMSLPLNEIFIIEEEL